MGRSNTANGILGRYERPLYHLWHPTTTADDKCSPTGQVVSGVGTRSDGKDVMTDPYSLGVTVITWTFTDGSENKTICTQNVIVTDNTAPVFLDCDNLKDITIELASDKCEATLDEIKLALGEHYASDNCSNEKIKGEPKIVAASGNLLPFPDVFKKDTISVVVWVFTVNIGNETKCFQNL